MGKIKSVLRVFWNIAKKYNLILFFLLFTTTIGGIIGIITPLFYKQFFDILTTAKGTQAVPDLVKVLLFILGMNGLSWVAYRTATFLDSYYHSHMTARIKQHAFQYLMHHSYSFFANNFGGALVQKVNRLARSFERILDRFIWDLIPMVVRVGGITIALWYLNRTIAIALLVWTVLFIVMHYFLSNWKLKYDETRAEKESKTSAVLADAITNHTTIQLFTGLSEEFKRYYTITEEHAKSVLKAWNISNTIEAIQTAFFVFIEFALLYLGVKYWSLGLITIGTIVLLQTYLGNIISRLWDFGRVIRDVYEAIGDAKEMVDILELPHEIKDAKDSKPLKIKKGEIEFKDVKFQFPSQKQVLKGVSLKINPGEKIAFIGPSGAGKSTLVRLLFRLYELKEGSITIDNQNIANVTQESLRGKISLVPQDPVLFHRTLLENIRYGRKDATDAEVQRVAKLAHCDEFINRLPKRYDTFVGERGIKLSGGERQRVAIARAMLKNAPILVLDEATSSLDSHSEALIQDALEKLMKNKTTMVIAHRLSTIRKMNRIIVIDKGKILEQGTHSQLVKKNSSLYKKLWTLQAGGFVGTEKESTR